VNSRESNEASSTDLRPVRAESVSPFRPHSSAPPAIPDHELLWRIGSGSYGEVWLARDVSGQYRAVKIVYRHSFDQDKPYEREFAGIRKFEPISREHEGHVDILHVGRNDAAGHFYYLMELADDANVGQASSLSAPPKKNSAEETGKMPVPLYAPRTLKHDLRTRGALPVAECLQIALSLTRALEHLHAHGLVHRDIKPSNIIFVKGVPKLADIGLVTSVDATRSFVGTDGYIPPEGPGTPPADLYSLGKVLYECVTGKDRLDFPELPADWRTRPDFEQLLEFNEILTKACDGEQSQRYQSADEMCADFALIDRGQSVKQKRTADRRLNIAKRICAAAALLVFTAGALFTLFHEASTDFSHPAYRLSENLEASGEYRDGDQCLRRDTKEGLEQALKHLTAATNLDPRFTVAYNGLFEVYIRGQDLGLSSAEARAKVRLYASKLMELAPKLAEAQAAQAYVDFVGGVLRFFPPRSSLYHNSQKTRVAKMNWAQNSSECR